MLVCLLAAGLYFSVRTGWFQFRRTGLWLRKTAGELMRSEGNPDSKEDLDSKEDPGRSWEKRSNGERTKASGISQRQSICTALAATVGTGNIVGVATAIVAGGPGAVFWMWVSACLGMMTGFAEKVLGMLYRKQKDGGGYQGGPMTYMEDGLGIRWLAIGYAFLCVVASFGVGNMTQVHSLSQGMETAFGVPVWVTGMITAVVLAVVLMGGIHGIASLAEKLVPFMVVLYLGSALVVLGSQWTQIPAAFGTIMREALGIRPAAGGVAGFGMARAMSIGVARGTFTHEAGVGSSVFAHSAADTKEPVEQGMWGIFEVFVDTIVVCTVTALVILTTGLNQGTALDGAPLTMACFSVFFPWGRQLIAVCLALFGFASLVGWSYYGQQSAEYLWGRNGVRGYQLVYIAMVIMGAVASLEVVWKLADVCNGLMAIPNLAALCMLRRQVLAALTEYEGRKKKQSLFYSGKSVYTREKNQRKE